MRRIAALLLLWVFGTLLPSATVIALAAPQQLLPSAAAPMARIPASGVL
jgi:hypothetical protein